MAGGIVAGLASALVYFLFVDSDPVVVAATTPPTASTTTTSTPLTSPSTVTTTEATTTTSAEDRVEEVRAIVQELYAGWLSAISLGDPDALWKVAATRQYHDAGLEAMDVLSISDAPQPDEIGVEELEILLDRDDCLVVFSSVEIPELDISTTSVDVLWPDARYGWRFASTWKNKIDLWLNDCDLREREATP